jgi:hypothetical protein
MSHEPSRDADTVVAQQAGSGYITPPPGPRMNPQSGDGVSVSPFNLGTPDTVMAAAVADKRDNQTPLSLDTASSLLVGPMVHPVQPNLLAMSRLNSVDGLISRIAGNKADSHQQLMHVELEQRRHQFEELIALSETLERDEWALRKAGKFTRAKEIENQKKRQVYNQWLFVLELLIDETVPAEFRLRLLRSMTVAPKTWLNKACKNYKPVWVWINWLRLLLLRIKRIFVGSADAVAAQTQFVKTADNIWANAYTYLGHLGYAIYFVRLFMYTIPCLISAAKEDGWAGFKRVWVRESESIWNDLVWSAVGLTTSFILSSTVVCTAIVVGLYLFDVINIAVHANNKKKKLKKEFSELFAVTVMSFYNDHRLYWQKGTSLVASKDGGMPCCRQELGALWSQFVSNKVYQDAIKAAPESLQNLIRKKLMRDMLHDANPNLANNFELVDALADMDRINTEYCVVSDKMVTGLIEANVLLGGMIISGMGTIAFALCSGIGLGGSASIASTVTAMCAGAAAMSLTPAAIIGLTLIAVGAAIVMAMCITRVVKKARAHHKKVQLKKAQLEEGGMGDSPSRISILSDRPKMRRDREAHDALGHSGMAWLAA